MLWASILAFVGATTMYLRSGRASAFHPVTIYLIFHFVTFVLRPLIAFYNGYDLIYRTYRFRPSWSEKATVIAGANLGMFVFVLAALAFGRAVPRFEPTSDATLERYKVPLLVTCAIVGPLGIMSMIAVFSGDQMVRLDAATGIAVNTTGNGYLFDAQLMLATLTGMIAYVFRFRWLSLLPFAVFVFFRAGTGSRGAFISAIFFLILLFLHSQRRRWITARALGLGAIGVIMFRLVGNDRGAAIQSLLGWHPAEVYLHPLRFLESMDWANMEFFEYLVYAVPQRTGTYDFFLSLLQIVTEPIPRALWSGKPIGAPIKLFNLFDYGFPIGMSYSLPGAGWIELGWGGVIAMCAGFAWIYGRAYNRFMTSTQSPFAVMLYAAFACTSIVAFRDGLVLTILKQALFYLAPVLLMGAVAHFYRFQGAVPSAPVNRRAQRRGAVARDAETPKERRRARMVESKILPLRGN
ncbi:MAG: O-antigen polymerase [Croceibacterium sp.]